jgi:hypothetical protein
VDEDFESFAEEDEAGIGVFGTRAGRGFDGEFEAGADQAGGRGVVFEEADVSGKAGRVREEMMKVDVTRE